MNQRILLKAEQAAEDVIWLRREIRQARNLTQFIELTDDLLVAIGHYQEVSALLWLNDRPKVSVNEVN